MQWMVEPFRSFKSFGLEVVTVSDTCTGGGTLRHCSCIGCLIICSGSSSLAPKK